MNKILVIIPTYDEKDNIGPISKAVFDFLPDSNILFVDDNSPDKTGQIADNLAKIFPIKVIHRKKKSGLGSAYIAAFDYALSNKGELIFEMDADFSHNPQDIPRFLEEIKKGYDVVLGSRKIKGGKIKNWNWQRHFASNGAMWFSRFLLGLKIYDVTTGFRCYKRAVLKSLDLKNIKSNGYAFQEEMIFWCEKKGFKIKEIPIVFEDRRYGRSKLSVKDIVEFFIKIIQLRLKNF